MTKIASPVRRTLPARRRTVKNSTPRPWRPEDAVEDLAATTRRLRALARAVECAKPGQDAELLLQMLLDEIDTAAEDGVAQLAALDSYIGPMGWVTRI